MKRTVQITWHRPSVEAGSREEWNQHKSTESKKVGIQSSELKPEDDDCPDMEAFSREEWNQHKSTESKKVGIQSSKFKPEDDDCPDVYEGSRL